MTQRLHGKVAVVTGATQGIGADIARALARDGARRVFIVGRGAQAGAAVAADIGEAAEAVEADITDDQAIDRCVTRALEVSGQIDILVNCACIYDDAGLASSRAQWHATLDVNLVSAAVFTQKVEPHMRAGAVVVNLGSVGGKFGTANRAIYPASKAALIQITRNFAVTLAPRPTRAVVVSVSTFTVAEPDTDTLPEAPPAAVMAISSSLESALMRRPSSPLDVRLT